jgi:hypothetical protein
MTADYRSWLAGNWFALVVPPLILVEWLVARSLGGEAGPMLELVVLFDLCLFMPALYLLCYRGRRPVRQLALRAAALVCLGIYIATYLVPEAAQRLLPHLGWARTAGLAVLLLIEFRLLVMTLRLVWGRDASAEEVQAASGAPAWIVQLMVLEARFWKSLWRMLRGPRD